MLYPSNLVACSSDQGQLRYKGGEIARLVPRLWLVNWQQKWMAYSRRFVRSEHLLYDHQPAKAKKEGLGLVYRQVCRPIAPSLAVLGNKYTQYTEEELDILRPHLLL